MSLSNMYPDHSNEQIAIIGLGFVGLPLAMLLVHKGFKVIGIDIDITKINNLNEGKSLSPDIDGKEVKELVSAGQLTVTTDYDRVKDADIIIIAVPTPLGEDQNPELSYLESVGRALSPRIQKGQLIILESSSFPGTTRDILMPLLKTSGLQIGRDVHLAYSPERIDPGNKDFSLAQIPKVVSGLTEKCADHVFRFYSKVFDQVFKVSSLEVAELSKLLENTYRLINISFMNEFAQLCDELQIDAWEVINASSTKPYGFQAFYPGPGIGGHCIPVDPLYLQWKAKQSGFQSRFITLAHIMNEQISNYIADQIKEHLSCEADLKDVNILIYGVTYKKDTSDIRESPALSLIRVLLNWGASIHYHDPYIPEFSLDGLKYSSEPFTDDIFEKTDCVLIATDHSQIPIEHILEKSKFVYDTRNVTKDLSGKANVVRFGGGGPGRALHKYVSENSAV
ncbi:nucleotide sugar dehydrogenase [Paenibacillus jiagnxiensis]|uniref:nucleotide sugar dehydrogenase n=1 Tax=Paenibacillus jiagnxiensis TaxID=3228926 RepID=UPI0033A0020B